MSRKKQVLVKNEKNRKIDESCEALIKNVQDVLDDERASETLELNIDVEIDLDFDVLIVDEAHHYYFAEMIQSIIRHFNFKKQLLLTGTPAPFGFGSPENIVEMQKLVDVW